MSEYRPVKRTVYLQGESDFEVTISDGQDGLGDKDSFALTIWGTGDVYITRRDWKQICNAVEEYFSEMTAAEMEATDA